MSYSNLSMWVSSKPSSISFQSSVSSFQLPPHTTTTTNPSRTNSTQISCKTIRELREQMSSVKNTKKITDAMKLVAAARVRRAQQAVVNSRPFSEAIVEVLFNINEQLQGEDIDIPLSRVRPVKKVAIVVVTGSRGLCGNFNSAVLKKTEARILDLKNLGLQYTIISVGRKGNIYFERRPQIPVGMFSDLRGLPTNADAKAIADDVYGLFVREEVDKVELLYTKFVSLVKVEPVIQTLLPVSPRGEVCDINGNCVDAAEDEFFRLTTKEGKLTVERDVVKREIQEFPMVMQFDQDPVVILESLLPMYLTSQVLRALQESLASELAARMTAMTKASDNAKDLITELSRQYNRQRQAKITNEICEIIAGSDIEI